MGLPAGRPRRADCRGGTRTIGATDFTNGGIAPALAAALVTVFVTGTTACDALGLRTACTRHVWMTEGQILIINCDFERNKMYKIHFQNQSVNSRVRHRSTPSHCVRSFVDASAIAACLALARTARVEEENGFVPSKITNDL